MSERLRSLVDQGLVNRTDLEAGDSLDEVADNVLRRLREEHSGNFPLPAPEQSDETETLLREEIRKIQERHSLLD